jgi:hypothetical protein
VIWESALEKTRKWDVRLLIVSDDIPEQLRLAVTYLPSDVLLSAVEFQVHHANGQESASTGIVSASGTPPTKIRAALKEYFSSVTLDHATVQRISSGAAVSQPHGRGKAGTRSPSRPYEDHLKKLGEDTVPGQALKMLKKKAEKTGGKVHEGQAALTPRLYGLPGLNVDEYKGELWLGFWASAFAPRRDEALKVFQKHFDLKDKKDIYNATNSGAEFQPITKKTPRTRIKRLVDRLEKLYKDLRKLK